MQYKLYVMNKLQPTEADFPAFTERLFVVSAAPLPHNEVVPIVVPPTNVTLKGGIAGVVNRGSLSLGARVANSQVGRGEKLVICLACRNIDAASDISRIQIKLVEHIYWAIDKNSNTKFKSKLRGICGVGGATGGRTQRDGSLSPLVLSDDELDDINDNGNIPLNTIKGDGKGRQLQPSNSSSPSNGGGTSSRRSHEHTRVLVEMPDVTFPGFVKEKTARGINPESQVQPLMDLSHAEMYEDLKSKNNAISLIVPNDTRDTYYGHLLLISHSVQITVYMEGNLCKDLTSVITIPLRIGSPPEIQEAKAIAINYGDFQGMAQPSDSLKFPERVEVVGFNDHSNNDEQQLQAPQPHQMKSKVETRHEAAVPDAATFPPAHDDNDHDDDSIGAERPSLLRACPSMGKRVSASAPFGAQVPSKSASMYFSDLDMRNVIMRPPSFADHNSFRVGGGPEMVLEMDNDYYNQDSENLNASFVMPPSTTMSDAPPTPVGLLRGFSSQVAAYNNQLSNPNAARSATSEVPLHSPNVNFDTLLVELGFAVDDFDFLTQKMFDASWKRVFATLTSTEFGLLVANVKNDNDQPRVAALVASSVHESDHRGDDDSGGFTCEYVVAAVRNSVDWTRCEVVTRLLPFCTDLLMAFHTIQDELNDWEQVITANEFEEAIAMRSGSHSQLETSDFPSYCE